jgi:hypothetical protein
MRKFLRCCTIATAALAFAPAMIAQMPAGGPPQGARPAAEEKATPIANGGIFVPGWKATVDAGAVKQGQSEKDSLFKQETGQTFHVMTGPALTYWNPKMVATGDYTVMANFNEPNYMNRNDHPHPYGIFIAGNDMGTPEESGLYCAAYGNGRFIVRGFGPAPFQMNGRGEANDAVHKAAGPGQPVSQAISVQVKGDSVSCIINGTTVGTYKKADLIGPGKLKSTDGVVGIRFAHNTDATVSDFMMMK